MTIAWIALIVACIDLYLHRRRLTAPLRNLWLRPQVKREEAAWRADIAKLTSDAQRPVPGERQEMRRQ